MLKQLLIRFNNFLTRRRRVRVAPENLLLLLPHCLQWSDCKENIARDVANCKRCGKCRVKEMVELTEKYGIRCVVASGGRQATSEVRRKETRAVVAVACDKELTAGILATVPKPVVAVGNAMPCGACQNTTVDPFEVEAAIRSVLKSTPEDEG